jgi:hypothetical protein
MTARAQDGPASEPFPEPTVPAASRTEVFLRYLDYFRSRLTAKADELPTATCGAAGAGE